MSHSPKYVGPEFITQPLQPIAAGKTGRPEVITNGGAKASGKIVFTGNLIAGDTVTINGLAMTAKAEAAPAVGKIVFTGNLIAGDTVTVNDVVFTCMASGAAGELQFDVGGSLSLSLDSLITALNACTDPDVSYATYTKTDTNTAVTSTSDTNNATHNSIILASDHSTVVVTQPTGGVNAATAVQFDVKGTLSLSLDQLVSQLNASVNVLWSIATYTKTDTNTALTVAFDGYGSAQNSIALASTHSTVVLTQPSGGSDLTYVSLDTEHTQINFASAITRDIYLPDGDESQRKTIAMLGSGTANIISANDMLPGTTNNYAMNGADVLVLIWLGAKWRLLLNEGATAS